MRIQSRFLLEVLGVVAQFDQVLDTVGQNHFPVQADSNQVIECFLRNFQKTLGIIDIDLNLVFVEAYLIDILLFGQSIFKKCASVAKCFFDILEVFLQDREIFTRE